MSAVPKTKLTPAEYLAIERKAEFKSEYYRGEMFAMAGARFPHNATKDNLIAALGGQFRDGPCRTLSSDQRVNIPATTLYTYPDIVIICEPPVFEDAMMDTLLNPQVIVEILSDSTESYDRGAKASQYKQITSLREFVIVGLRTPVIERHIRQDDGSWNVKEFAGLDAVLQFASVSARVPLSEVYRGVEFPESGLR